MKNQIGTIAKAMGITPQAIRLYEEKGILQCRRDEESGYRLFERKDIVALLRSRLLRSYGFSVSDIAAMLNDLDGEQVLALYHARQEELAGEIAALEAVQSCLASLEAESRETMERVGTCARVEAPGCYLFPFMEGGQEVRALDADSIQRWNERYPFRWNASLIGREDVYRDEMHYRMVALLEEAQLPSLPAEFKDKVICRPAHSAVHAWFYRAHSTRIPPQRDFSFALRYLEEQGLRLNGDALLSPMLLLHRSTEQQVYFRVELPVEPK